MSGVKAGDKFFETHGATWVPVSCRFHSGDAIIDVDDDGNDIFSTDVGHQSDCIDCQRIAFVTVDHANRVIEHDASAVRQHGFAARNGDLVNEVMAGRDFA